MVRVTPERRVFDVMTVWARRVEPTADVLHLVHWVVKTLDEQNRRSLEDLWQAVLWLRGDVTDVCLAKEIVPDCASAMLLLLEIEDLQRLPVVYEMSARLHRFTSSAVSFPMEISEAAPSKMERNRPFRSVPATCTVEACRSVGILPVTLDDPPIWNHVHSAIHAGYRFGTETGVFQQPYISGLNICEL